ncbi:hypothetical protein [Roseateles amylovorans]|uniref:Secreted protein n=1 Tax=Roseateles amylovorans TaxID=2978473 RepID=A0ABY6AVC3_9BURK|nr:hypothetical protein [Roseateles amylovorans]UXH76258.1 hypothetical protein N4261_14405 [Roseateles amylovorans]
MKLLTHTSTTALVTAGAVLSAVMMIAAPVFAAEGDAKPKAPTTAATTPSYQQERADCLAGKGGQDVKTCLKEAGAAREESRRGTLKSASTEELANNAVLRCQRVPEADRDDCRSMVMGQGLRDGSVEDGAILKRIDRMVEENPTAAGAPVPPASAASTPWVGASAPRPKSPPPLPPQPKGSAPGR